MSTLIQSPSLISPVNNYMFISEAPTPAFSGLTNYYIQYNVLDYDNGSNIIMKNNVKVYDAVWRGLAVFDLHEVLQNYVSWDYAPTTHGVINSTNSIFAYDVTVKEYTGSTLLSTSSAILKEAYVINAAIDRNTTWNYTDYRLINSTGKFLSPWVGPRYYRLKEENILSFLDFTTPRLSGFCIRMYDDYDNQYLFHNDIYYWANTGATGTLGNLRHFGFAPSNIDGTAFYDSGGTLYYNIISTYKPMWYEIFAVRTSGGTISQCSEVIKVIIDRDCTKIRDFQLTWLNKLGGWESYTFYGEVHEYLDIETERYRRIDYSQVGYQIGTAQKARGEQVLNMDIQRRFSVKSKVLDDDMSRNLSTIFESIEVFWYDADNATTYPIFIDAQSVEVQYNRNGRAIYTFDFVKAAKEITQTN